MDVGPGRSDLTGVREPPSGRKTLRLSRAVEASGRQGARRARVDGGASGHKDADPSLMSSVGDGDPAAHSAAQEVLQAAQRAAAHLGDQTVADGMNAAQVLAEPSAREAATHWRAGPAARRVTAALARLTSALQPWGPRLPPGVAVPRPVLEPVRPRPLQAGPQPRTQTFGAYVLQLVGNWRWRTWLAIFFILFFPKAVALLVALVCKWVVKGLVSLLLYFGRELVAQLSLTMSEMEDALVSWLTTYLQGETPLPAYLQVQSATPASASPGVEHVGTQSSPGVPPTQARPIELLTVALLGLNLWRGQPGGVGNP